MKRRDFLVASAGLAWTAAPRASFGETKPCPPPSLTIQGGQTVQSECRQDSGHPAWLDSIAPGTWGQVAQNTIRQITGSTGTDPYSVNTSISCWAGGLGYFPTAGTYGTYCLGLSGGHGANWRDKIYAFDLETGTWSLLKDAYYTSGVYPNPATGYGPHGTSRASHYYSHYCGSAGTGKIVVTRGLYDDSSGIQARAMPYPSMIDVASLKSNPSNPSVAAMLGRRWDKWNLYGGWANHYDDIAFEDYNPSPPAGRASRNRIILYGRWRVTFDASLGPHPVFRPDGSTWVTPSGWETIPADGPYYGGICALDPATGISTSLQDFAQGKYPCWWPSLASSQEGQTNAALDTDRDVWGVYFNGVLSIADPERPHIGFSLGSMPSSKTSFVSSYSGRYWTVTTAGTPPSVGSCNTLLYSKRAAGFVMWAASGPGSSSNNNVHLARFTGATGWHGGMLTQGQQPGTAAQYTWSNVTRAGGFNMANANGMVSASNYASYNKAKICRFPDGEEVLLICNSAGYDTDSSAQEGPAVYAFRIP